MLPDLLAFVKAVNFGHGVETGQSTSLIGTTTGAGHRRNGLLLLGPPLDVAIAKMNRRLFLATTGRRRRRRAGRRATVAAFVRQGIPRLPGSHSLNGFDHMFQIAASHFSRWRFGAGGHCLVVVLLALLLIHGDGQLSSSDASSRTAGIRAACGAQSEDGGRRRGGSGSGSV